jgi:hypothetical protein
LNKKKQFCTLTQFLCSHYNPNCSHYRCVRKIGAPKPGGKRRSSRISETFFSKVVRSSPAGSCSICGTDTPSATQTLCGICDAATTPKRARKNKKLSSDFSCYPPGDCSNTPDPDFLPMTPSRLISRYKYSKTEELEAHDFCKYAAPEFDDVVLAKIGSINLYRRDTSRLQDSKWLNDELVNSWMELLKQKSDRQIVQGLRKLPTAFLSSFFYSKLTENGYSHKAVSRWTEMRKINLFDCEKVFIPINIKESHWLMIVVELTLREIYAFDSLGSTCLIKTFIYLSLNKSCNCLP